MKDVTDLWTGSLIKLSSKSTSPTNGILRIQSNDATNGKLISIEADGLTDGTAIDINNDGTELSTGSLIKVTSKASGTDAGNNGLIKVIANDMNDGKGLVIETQKLPIFSNVRSNLKFNNLVWDINFQRDQMSS